MGTDFAGRLLREAAPLVGRLFLAKIGPFPAIPLIEVVLRPLLDNGLGRVMC